MPVIISSQCSSGFAAPAGEALPNRALLRHQPAKIEFSLRVATICSKRDWRHPHNPKPPLPAPDAPRPGSPIREGMNGHAGQLHRPARAVAGLDERPYKDRSVLAGYNPGSDNEGRPLSNRTQQNKTNVAGFFASADAQPHPARTKAILKAHPEIRQLMGRNPWTGLVLLFILGMQLSIAGSLAWLGPDYWWLTIAVAYLLGAFTNHSLYVIIHEATHNLVFASRFANKCAAVVADLPNVFPGAIGFGICHLKHHAHQGDYDQDADVASEWEARLIGNRWCLKALWLLLFPFFQLTRPARIKAFSVFDGWTIASIAAAIAFDAAILFAFGWVALLYLGASMLFSIGLHPLGARWIQEHYTLQPAQETFSYYGPLNLVALNVGYHNEHHDFPSIPWNRLPRLRALAPEFYDTLEWRGSWSRLLVEFIFDRRYSLHSRVLRIAAG